MKKAILYVLCAILTLFAACKSRNEVTETTTVTSEDVVQRTHADSISDIISNVRQQSALYTTECKVHKIVLFSDETRLGGKLLDISLPGERKVAIPIDVTIKGYVDFANFGPENVLLQDSLCVITLPEPKVIITASKIDHKATRQYVSLTRSKFSDTEISRLAGQGEDTIANHLTRYGIVERSRESCARTLIPVLTRQGLKESNIVIRFSKNYNDAELRRLTNFQK